MRLRLTVSHSRHRCLVPTHSFVLCPCIPWAGWHNGAKEIAFAKREMDGKDVRMVCAEKFGAKGGSLAVSQVPHLPKTQYLI